MGEEEGTAWGVFSVPEKQFLLLTNQSMITFLSFFSESVEIFKLLFLSEWNTVDSLERFVLRIAEPIGWWVFKQLNRSHESSVWDMRSSAKINKVTNSVNTS